MCESADGDIYQKVLTVSNCESHAHSFAMRKRAPELSQPVKKPRADALTSALPICEIADGEFIQSVVGRLQSVVDSLPTESDLDKNDRDRAKVRSFAMRKRVAEMQLQPPRFAALKQHCIDVIAGLQAGMYPPYAIDNASPYAIDNADGIVSPSGTDAFQTTVNRKLLKLRKRYYNNRHSWTWTDHFKLHHTVWLSNYVLRVPVEGLNTGGCYQCRADGAVYVRDCLHDPQQHLVSLFAVAPGTSLPINHTTTVTITLNHIICTHLLDAAEAHDDTDLDDLPDLV